jgi:S-formylglutathione hydrolase FrmB
VGEGRKLYIVYSVGTGAGMYTRGGEYEISEPYRWEDMSRRERVKWAKAALKRKNSGWDYVQIHGLPY